MAFNINSYRDVYEGKDRVVVYTNGTAYLYPLTNIVLAPSTDTANPIYYAGRILAVYGADAPSPELEGMAVNFDPASTIASQKIPVGVYVGGPLQQGSFGLDTTNVVTATNTVNRTTMAKFLVGLQLFKKPLVDENTPAVYTAFEAAFEIETIDNIYFAMEETEVITIQGKAAAGVAPEVLITTGDAETKVSNAKKGKVNE